MEKNKKQVTTVGAYLKGFPKDVQGVLKKILQTIRKASPKSQEVISYGMPTFKLNGTSIVSVGAYEKHIGLYPIPRGTAAFRKALAPYKKAKSTVRLPLDHPIPYPLVKQMVLFRVKEIRVG